MAWAAIPNASLASFWCSSRKPNKFWFAGLKTSFWNLCSAVAIDWCFTYFLRKTARNSPRFFPVGPLMFLKVCSESPLMRMEVVDSVIFGQLIVNLRFIWNRSSNSSSFSDFPSNVGIVVVGDFGSLEILLMLFWKFTELLLFANCWRANKTWFASIVAGVFSLRNCGWLVERFFFCFPEDVLGGSKWLPRELQSYRGNYQSALWLLSPCRGHLLGQSFGSTDRGRDPLQDEDSSGSRPHSFPGYYLMRSGRAPEWFRSSPVVAGS